MTYEQYVLTFPNCVEDNDTPWTEIRLDPANPASLVPLVQKPGEYDPNGISAHASGAKLDGGKLRFGLVLGGFARALTEVVRVGTYGAKKYTDNGWMEVPNGISRYGDAKERHYFAEMGGQERDPDTELLHAAHEAWNALARLDLKLREMEAKRNG